MEIKSPLTIRCLTIDDEEKAHQALGNLIRDVSWLTHSGCCYSVLEAVDAVSRQPPDLIFLDVLMPGLTGLDFLRLTPSSETKVIMTSAFREHALDGFDYDVVDFLLKPVSPQRFLKAVLKVRPSEKKHQTRELPEPLPKDLPAPESRKENSGIWVRSGGKLYKVFFDEIYAIQGLKDYVKIHYKDGTLITHGSVGNMAPRLPPAQFIRIHRSHIINRHAIRLISGNTVTLVNGTEFLISGCSSREAVIKRLVQPSV